MNTQVPKKRSVQGTNLKSSEETVDLKDQVGKRNGKEEGREGREAHVRTKSPHYTHFLSQRRKRTITFARFITTSGSLG